jgi:hypothetical protein
VKKFLALLLLATVSLLTMGAGCGGPTVVGNGGDDTINADDGKHYVSAIGKWKYGTYVTPAAGFVSTCKWEIWGLQNDGWQLLYKGKGLRKVQLPPEGVYKSAYLKSKSCGKWRQVKR